MLLICEHGARVQIIYQIMQLYIAICLSCYSIWTVFDNFESILTVQPPVLVPRMATTALSFTMSLPCAKGYVHPKSEQQSKWEDNGTRVHTTIEIS